jgi:hypothetical protein
VAAHHHLLFHEAVNHKARLESRVEHARQQVEQLLLMESIDRLNLLVEKTMKVLAAAEEQGDLKLMMQAIREAGRLTKMINALPVDLEAASLFLAATHQDWPRTASPLPTQAWVRNSVRQAIQHYLKNPCVGSHFEDELSIPQAPPREKAVPAVRQVRPLPRPQAAGIPWSSTPGNPSILAAARATADPSTAAPDRRGDPG